MIGGKLPRVLFITYSHNIWGGIEKWFHDLTLWLQNRGWDIYVGLAKGARFNNPDAYLAAHSHIQKPLIMDGSVGTEEARIGAIVRACLSCKPDIVFPVGIGAVFPAIERLKTEHAQLRLVIPVHSTNPDYLQNVVDNFFEIDHVAGISRLIEHFLQKNLPGEGRRIHYIKNRAAPPKMGKQGTKGPLKIAFVGRLDDMTKGIFDLVPFCRKLHKAGAEVEIHIFGSGPDEEALKHRLVEYLSAGKVVFHGFFTMEKLYEEVYPAMDILVMFSKIGEGSPFVLPEAMHHGVVPVISRFLGHASEALVRHGQNALTFPVGDTEAAVNHILRLFRSPDLLKKLSAQAQKDVESDVEEVMYKDWENLLFLSSDEPPKVLHTRSVKTRLSSPDGRLEKYGLPPDVANWIRKKTGRAFPHGSGFDEWPGSQPVGSAAADEVRRCLRAIEDEAAARLYDNAMLTEE